MTTVRSLLVLGAFAFLATSSARADFKYSFNTQLSGSFSVTDLAVANGMITTGDITAFLFNITVNGSTNLTFNSAVVNNGPIGVIPATGDLLTSNSPTPPTLVSTSTDGTYTLSIFFNGPANNTVNWQAIPLSGEGDQPQGGATFTVQAPTSTVPEPASIFLMASGGAALFTLYGRHRRGRNASHLTDRVDSEAL
jgi:hypothetical protein